MSKAPSKATKTGTQSPARQGADNHDVIRVRGTRENNLKDISIALPKRRLTVFTGVSGSGKSSDVRFDPPVCRTRAVRRLESNAPDR